jgi:hypothetical protein
VSQNKLTEMQTLILWALLAKGGEGFQKDIKPEATRADRAALEREGHIRSEKRGRSIWLEATDTGWRWAAENLGADLPKRTTAGTLVLQNWLTLLKDFMVARNVTLADILGPQPKIKPGAPRDGTAANPSEHPDYAVLRDRVRKAYLELTGGNLNKSVLLSDLREKLKDIDRPALDAGLKRMHLEAGTSLKGLENPRDITPGIRDAEISFSGDPMHVLWITK